MRNIAILLILSFGLTFATTSCKEKKKDDGITVKIPKEPEKPKGTIAKDSIDDSNIVDWGGEQYTVNTLRKADKNLPTIKDEATGDKYYDNRVSLEILRQDGSVAFSKSFTKENFKEHIEKALYSSFSLLAMTYMETEGGSLKFVVGVGEPDDNSENYITLQLLLNKNGGMTVKPLVIDELTGDEAMEV